MRFSPIASIAVAAAALGCEPAAPLGPALPPDPFPGMALREHADPIASYTLRATLDPEAHTIHGEGTITWKNASKKPQEELYFHLYLNGFKTDRSVFLRTPVGGFRGGGFAGSGWVKVRRLHARELGQDIWPAEAHTPGDPEDETDIRVPLPAPVQPGGTLTMDVAWDSRLPALTMRTGHVDSFHMVGQWFPKLARLDEDGRWAHFPFERLSEFYADFGTYDVTVDTPEAFVVGATGVMKEETRAGGRAVRRFVQGDVHDFAFTAWDKFVEKSADADGVRIRCLFPPGLERGADLEIETAAYGLAAYGAAYGRYPYATLTLVHPPEGAPEAGGMEYPTLITTGGAWYTPWTGVRSLENVTIHELGHQWFHGLVATDEHAWPFLDEGVNSYAESVSMEARYPGHSIARTLGVEIGLDAYYRASGLSAVHDTPVATASGDFVTGSDYGSLVYSRTASILGTLRNVYGDEAARRALGLYTRRHRFGHPGPQDLLAAYREAMGAEAADALQVALFDKGWVDYVVEDLSSHACAAPTGTFGDPDAPKAQPPAPCEGFEGNVVVRRLGTLRLPVDVEMRAEDGTLTRVRWDAADAATRLPYAGKSRLVGATIDPEHRVLIDEKLANNARRLDRSPLAPRVLERALFAAESALLLGAP